MKKIAFYLIFFLTVCSALTSRADTYRRIIKMMPFTLDPASANDSVSIHILNQVAEGLVKYERNVLAPGLAEKWEISRDLTKYTFHLKKNAKFSDGTLITADDVVNSLNYILSAMGNHSTQLNMISGFSDLVSKKAKKAKGIKKIADNIVEITIDKPFVPFLDLLTAVNYAILPEQVLKSLSNGEITPFVSSGPYYISEVVPASHITLRKNTYYYDSKSVYFDNIRYDLVTDERKAFKGFVDGTYDDIWPFRIPEDTPNFDKKFEKIPSLTATIKVINFNLTHPHVNNMALRKFIAAHLDIDEYLQKKGFPPHYRAYGLIPKGMMGHHDSPIVNYSEVNESALEQAGCKTSNPCRFELYHNRGETEDGYLRGLLKPLEHYKDKITIVPKYLINDLFLKRYFSSNYDLIMVVLEPDSAESYTIINSVLDDKLFKHGSYRQKIRELLASARNTNDRAERSAIYAKADEVIIQHVGIIPIQWGDEPYWAVKKGLTGYFIPFLGRILMKMSEIRRLQ